MRLLMVTLAVVLASGPCAGGDTKSDKTNPKQAQAFKELGEFFVGGVWTGTDAKGDKYDQRWEWVLNKSFLKVTWDITGDKGITMIGIDPASGKLTWWGYDDKGRVWKGTTVAGKIGEWTEEGTGDGKAGINSWKVKLSKVGADKARADIQVNIVDGKKFSPEVVNLTRKK